MAEIDYMVLDKAGVDAEINVIDDLTSGAYDMPDLELDDIPSARHLVARHRDLKIGLTDAVNAVLAERFGTNEMLTTDQRHFRSITRLPDDLPRFGSCRSTCRQLAGTLQHPWPCMGVPSIPFCAMGGTPIDDQPRAQLDRGAVRA